MKYTWRFNIEHTYLCETYILFILLYLYLDPNRDFPCKNVKNK